MWTQAKAQAEYVAMVKPAKDDLNAIKALTPASNVSDFKALCARISKEEYALVQALSAGRWPAKSQSAISTFTSAVAAEAVLFAAVKDATSTFDAIATLSAGASTALAVNGDSSVARVALGLSPT